MEYFMEHRLIHLSAGHHPRSPESAEEQASPAMDVKRESGKRIQNLADSGHEVLAQASTAFGDVESDVKEREKGGADSDTLQEEREKPEGKRRESGEEAVSEGRESSEKKEEPNLFLEILAFLLEIVNRLRDGGSFNVQEFLRGRRVRREMERIEMRLRAIDAEFGRPGISQQRKSQLSLQQATLEKQYKRLQKRLEERERRHEEQERERTEEPERRVWSRWGRRRGRRFRRRRERLGAPRNDPEKAFMEYVESVNSGNIEMDDGRFMALMREAVAQMSPREIREMMQQWVDSMNNSGFQEAMMEFMSDLEVSVVGVPDAYVGFIDAMNAVLPDVGVGYRFVLDGDGHTVSLRRARGERRGDRREVREDNGRLERTRRPPGGHDAQRRSHGSLDSAEGEETTLTNDEYMQVLEDIFAPLLALREEMEQVKSQRRSARSKYESENRGLARDFRRRGQNPGSQFWQKRREEFTSQMGGKLSLIPLTNDYWVLRKQCEEQAGVSFPMFLRMREGYEPAHGIPSLESRNEKVVVRDGSGEVLAIYRPWTGSFIGKGVVSKREVEEMYAAGYGRKSGNERTIVLGEGTRGVRGTTGGGRVAQRHHRERTRSQQEHPSRGEHVERQPSGDYVEFIPLTEMHRNKIIPVTIPAKIMKRIRMGDREHTLLIKQVRKGKFAVPRTLRDVRTMSSFDPERWSTAKSADQVIAERLGLKIKQVGGGVEIIIPEKWVWDGTSGKYNDGPPIQLNGRKVVSARLRNSPHFNS